MSTRADRDKAVERLLGSLGSLRGPDPSGQTCVDAADLAAWVDDSLSRSRVTAIEAHLVTCARCQAIVAALTAAEAEPVRAWWTRWQMFVPMAAAAAAAAVTLVVWTHRAAPAPTPSTTIAQTDMAPVPVPAPLVPAPPAVAVQPQPPAQPAANESSAPAPRAQAAGARAAAKQAFRAPARASETSPARAMGDMAADEAARANAGAAKPAEPIQVASAQAAPTPPPSIQPPPTGQAMPPVSSLAAPPPPQGRVSAASPLVDTKKTATGGQLTNLESTAVAEFVAGPDTRGPVATTSSTAAATSGRAGGGGAGRGARPTSEASLPRWRVFTSGTVSKSSDGGATWSQVLLEAGQFVLAGVAPTPQVCWLVGRAGLVLLTTNGQDFKSVTRPTSADLRFVRVEGNRLIVSAVDGTSFATTDEGRTWTVERAPQGFQTRAF
jgi:hypothetical protein